MNDMHGGMVRDRSISQVFVFLLLGVFAVFSTLMVLLGAQLYRGTVDQTDQHSERRVLYNYVKNIVRGNDSVDIICIDNRMGIDMLVFAYDFDGETYETMVYCYEGELRDLFIDSEQEFEPEYGESICKAQSFVPELDDGLLTIRMTDAQGQAGEMHIALRCSQEGAR